MLLKTRVPSIGMVVELGRYEIAQPGSGPGAFLCPSCGIPSHRRTLCAVCQAKWISQAELLVQTICNSTHVSRQSIMLSGGGSRIHRVRCLIVACLREQTPMSWRLIGNMVGKKESATMAAYRSARARRARKIGVKVYCGRPPESALMALRRDFPDEPNALFGEGMHPADAAIAARRLVDGVDTGRQAIATVCPFVVDQFEPDAVEVCTLIEAADGKPAQLVTMPLTEARIAKHVRSTGEYWLVAGDPWLAQQANGTMAALRAEQSKADEAVSREAERRAALAAGAAGDEDEDELEAVDRWSREEAVNDIDDDYKGMLPPA